MRGSVSVSVSVVLVATFRVARLTLQNSKTFVGRCRDRPSSTLPLTCPNVRNLTKKQNKKTKNDKKRK